MKADELRKKFIEFFEERGHKEIPAASLIPENDPSVLFTTAGMQQFKRYYIESKDAPAKRIVTIQPSMRTSDIDEVGDNSHFTFFEMLGNFSFGDYGKNDAIKWGLEFLKNVGINKSKIKASIFAGDDKVGKDEESLRVLQDLGVKDIKEMGREDNFWGPTGDEGPCGPTVELYINNLEVWNLVFNEYYCNKNRQLSDLENKGIDTGLGFERLLMILQGKDDIYETELFAPIITEIEEAAGVKYEDNKKAFRIIADHIRASVFLITDGVVPSNIGQGYVLRRLIRRLIRYWRLIGGEGPICAQLAIKVIENYKSRYIHLEDNETKIIEELQKEEEKFGQSLNRGLKEFGKQMMILTQWDHQKPQLKKKILPGIVAFNLFQTYGFPIEMTEEIAKEKGLEVDKKGFKKELKFHQEKSRTAAAGMFKGGLAGTSEIITKYHTATHLLLAALKQVLGEDVHQKGSHINEERLRFDFSYDKPMTEDEIKEVENIVNQKISENLPVVKSNASIEEAKRLGAEAQFIEKYKEIGKDLTLYSIGDPSEDLGQVFSRELCGGPHVKKTGELGKFKIIKEESSSAGIRRIKAVLE